MKSLTTLSLAFALASTAQADVAQPGGKLTGNPAIQLVKVAGGYRYQTHPDLSPYVERFLLDGQRARMSGAALETLAIVAYKQPLSRAQIASIRGVDPDAVLRTLQQSEPLANNLYVDSLAVSICTQLLCAHSRRQASGLEPNAAGRTSVAPGFQRLRDFIEASLDQDLRLAVLADEAGVSLYTFPRTFKHYFGATPHQYVLDRRMACARALLADTDLSICEVALEAGFSSQSHLASTFRKYTGVTPNAYRKTSGVG